MNPKTEGYAYLVFLQDKVYFLMMNPSKSWTEKHIKGFTKIYNETNMLLSLWNKAVVETSKGLALLPNKRKYIIAHMTAMIVTIQMLAQDIDSNGQQVLQEINDILEDLGAVIFEFGVLETSP